MYGYGVSLLLHFSVIGSYLEHFCQLLEFVATNRLMLSHKLLFFSMDVACIANIILISGFKGKKQDIFNPIQDPKKKQQIFDTNKF